MQDSLGKIRMAMGAALLGALFLPAARPMHIHLTSSSPVKDTVVCAAPEQVRLWFNEPVSVALSRIVLLAPDSTRVDLARVSETDDPKSVVAGVEGALQPGQYTVQWRTASKDGHMVRGDYTFRLAPDSSP